MIEEPIRTVEAPVVVVPAPAPAPAPAQVGDVNIAPKTTAAQDLVTAGQRRVNLIWETMQAAIAASVVSSTLYVSSKLALLVVLPSASDKQIAMAITAFMLISNLASLIIGFYFGRTNHQKMGGVGAGDAGR